MGRDCHVYKHDRKRLFISFDISKNNDSFTGYQLTPSQSKKHNETGIIGQFYEELPDKTSTMGQNNETNKN